VIVQTGQNPRYDSGEPYCEQTAIALPHVPAGFEVSANALATNREPGDAPGRNDLPAAEFESRARATLEAIRAWSAASESEWLSRRTAP
jgi:hypothetical protein